MMKTETAKSVLQESLFKAAGLSEKKMTSHTIEEIKSCLTTALSCTTVLEEFFRPKETKAIVLKLSNAAKRRTANKGREAASA